MLLESQPVRSTEGRPSIDPLLFLPNAVTECTSPCVCRACMGGSMRLSRRRSFASQWRLSTRS